MSLDYYKSPKPSWVTRSLWKAAGADRFLLERSTYSDHVKYSALGGIVFATGFMAALAGGYAFYIIFSPKGEAISSATSQTVDPSTDPTTAILSVIFGIIWGLIIFNIDRFIVASTGKGDGTEAITTSEIKSAIPRIIMGIIIAITISKPVELRMFKTEIDVNLHEAQMQMYNRQIQLVDLNFGPEIERIDDEISRLREEIALKREDVERKNTIFTREMDGLSGTGIAGKGPSAEEKKRIRDLAVNDLAILIAKNDPLIAKLSQEKELQETKIQQEKATRNGSNHAYRPP